MQQETIERKAFPRGDRVLLGITVIWGSTFAVTKNALDEISPLMLMGTRFALAAAIVGIYTWKDIRATSSRSLRAGVILGLFLGLGFVFQTVGLVDTTASKAGFLTGTLVVFTPLLQLVIERRMPTVGNLLGVVIVAVGLYIFMSPETGNYSSGDFLVLCCAVVYAFHVVYLDVFTKERFDREIVFWQFVTCSAVGFAALPFVPARDSVFSPIVIGSILYLAVFASAFAIFLLSKYQRETTPTRAAIIYTLEPVMAAVIAYFLIGERLGGSATLGAGIMFAGLLTSELLSAREHVRRGD